MTTRDPRACSHALLDVLSAAIADDVDDTEYTTRVEQLFDEISNDGRLLFGTWWALAHGHAIFLRKLLDPVDHPTATAVLQFIDPTHPDQPTDAQDVPIPERLSGQFLTAGLNDDIETAQALWLALHNPAEIREFCQLVWESTLHAGRAWWTSIQEVPR